MKTQMTSLGALKPNPRNARTHSKKQIQQIADSIKAFTFAVPIIAQENGMILAGHGRFAAAQLLGLTEVPVITVSGLSEAKQRALALADNKIGENAGWDREILAVELAELSEILIEEQLEIAITGFAAVEIDQIASDFQEDPTDPANEIDPKWQQNSSISRDGDVWVLGQHLLMCGDARSPQTLTALMEGKTAAMAFLDPPYNVRVRDIVGRGAVQHEEFAMASGEMARPEFVDFLKKSLGAVAQVSRPGAVNFVCMDWRHIGELLEAGQDVYAETLNLAVWVKTNAGQGSFYRSQHELIGVFRVGEASHQNNIELGRHGRYRSNVWRYPGVNTFRDGRLDELKMHPTVKPVALVSDAIKDCTSRGDVVIDTFSGSGTTILAAERVGRRAFALEIEPRFVDVAIRRWQAFTRKDAIQRGSGRCFDDIAREKDDAVLSVPSQP